MSRVDIKVLSLDAATSTGWAVGAAGDFQNGAIRFGSFRLPKRQYLAERLVIFRDRIVALLDEHLPDLVAYEPPYDPREPDPNKPGPRIPYNRETDKFLQKLEGVLLLTLADRGLPYEAYRSQSWRVTALGKGFGHAPKGSPPGLLKDMMLKRARSLGYNVKNNDQSDAIGILMHCLTGPPANLRAQPDLLDMAV